ncbi:MAG: hypothetical protein IPH09_17410 [bacterium]|nr:hypothetical protein [bacterium]
MKMSSFLISCFILSSSAAAVQAAIDPQSVGIGVYFDTEASALCHAPDGEMICYLMFTNITGQYVRAWICAVDIDTNLPASCFENWIAYGISVNDPEDPVTLVQQFIVSTENYMEPTDGHFIAAVRTVLTSPAVDVVSFRVFPNDDYWGPTHLHYVHTLGFETPFNVVNGDTNVPQTFITSGDCVVANEAITWGQMKALY